MEQFNGFMQNHLMPPPGECSCCIGPADAMVIVIVIVTKTQHTTNFYLAIIVLFY
jgi:hypothetical protein